MVTERDFLRPVVYWQLMKTEMVPDHFVEEVAALGMGEIHEKVRDLAGHLYGSQFIDLPVDDPNEIARRMDQGYAYLRSPHRQRLHRALGVVIAKVGSPVSGLAGAWIAWHSGQEPTFTLPVALFDQEITMEKKIQTMRQGAHLEPESPYQHASYVAHLRPDQQDKRLLKVPGIHTIRKMGIDELLQAKMVANKQMDLVGVRKFTLPELRGVSMLSLFTKRQYDLAEINQEMRWVYQNYPGIMKYVKPRHAGIGIRATLTNGAAEMLTLVHHGIRQWGDILYILNADLRTDFRMILAFMKGRALKGAWQGMKNVSRLK